MIDTEINPGDLVYKDNGVGVIGTYIGTNGTVFAYHTAQWSDTDSTSNITNGELIAYRYNYLDLRKKIE